MVNIFNIAMIFLFLSVGLIGWTVGFRNGMSKTNKTKKDIVLKVVHELQYLTKLYPLQNLFRRCLGYRPMPILMYHSVGEPPIQLYNLSLDTFERQMRIFTKNERCIR